MTKKNLFITPINLNRCFCEADELMIIRIRNAQRLPDETSKKTI